MQRTKFTFRYSLIAVLSMTLGNWSFAHSGELSIPLIAKKIDIGVMLKWTTSNEADADFFILEKSLDGEKFQAITEVIPTGNESKGSDYSFVDLFPEKDIMYYRIRLVYKDGKETEFKPVKTVDVPKTNFLISKMNTSTPSNDWSVNLEMFISGSLIYQLNSVDGNIVESGIKRVAEGYNEISFSLDGFEDGIYILALEMAGDTKTLTVQKIGNTTMHVSSN